MHTGTLGTCILNDIMTSGLMAGRMESQSLARVLRGGPLGPWEFETDAVNSGRLSRSSHRVVDMAHRVWPAAARTPIFHPSAVIHTGPCANHPRPGMSPHIRDWMHPPRTITTSRSESTSLQVSFPSDDRRRTSMEKHDEEKALRLNCDVQGMHRRASIRSTPSLSPRSTTPDRSLDSPIEASSPPETIVLGLWPHATGEQIQYYIEGYESLYPTAHLHLLRYSTSYDQQIGSVLDAITPETETQWSPATPNVLLHLFGDAGAAQGCRLLRAYKLRNGRALAVKTVVMDSVPTPTAPSLHLSLRAPAAILAYASLCLTLTYLWLLSTLTFWHTERRARQTQRDLQDPFLLPADARKCYIFAAKDLMFTWCDSPVGERASHDNGLERQEYAVKRSSIDEKGRWTGDQERYWLGIENAWEGR